MSWLCYSASAGYVCLIKANTRRGKRFKCRVARLTRRPCPQSYLDISDDGKIARFYGTLDIDTLGGAGFASQRTTTERQIWDLSHYDGLQLTIVKGDCTLSAHNNSQHAIYGKADKDTA